MRIALMGVFCLACGCATSGGGGSAGDAADGDSNANENTSDAGTNGAADGAELTGDAAAGAALFRDVTSECSACHGDSGEGTALAEESIRDATASELQAVLALGAQHSGRAQPDFTSQDLADLAAFLSGPATDIGTNGTAPVDTDTNGPPPVT